MKVELLMKNESTRLKSIRLAALQSDPNSFDTTYDQALKWEDDSWERQVQNLPTWVAVEEETDGDVGMVRLGQDNQDPKIGWLISMWVSPRARRKGVAKKLILELINYAKSQGLRKIKLDVGDHNQDAAALYEKMGFKRNGKTTTLSPPREHISEHQRVLSL